MAFQTGTTTGAKDFLSQLRTFALANGWIENLYSQNETGQGLDGDIFYLKGTGSGSDEIFIGIYALEDVPNTTFRLSLSGAIGYNSNSLLFSDQPGNCSTTYVPMQNSATMNYWMFVDSRRICAVIRTGSSYQFMYMGFIDQYATTDEYPYPLLIMGSSGSSSTSFNSNEISYSSSINPALTKSGNSVAWIRFIDGGWYPVYNFTNSRSSESHSIRSTGCNVWPTSLSSITSADIPDASDDYLSVSIGDFRSLMMSTAQGGLQTAELIRTENDTVEKSVPLLNSIIFMTSPQPQILGEIKNLYWCMLSDGITAEDTINDGVNSETYTVFQNIHRTDPWQGLAIKNE